MNIERIENPQIELPNTLFLRDQTCNKTGKIFLTKNVKKGEQDLKEYLTPWEELWTKFDPENIPSSLELPDNFVNLLLPDKLMLDIGCGNGKKLASWAEKRNVIGMGIDINLEAIKHAATSIDSLNVEFEYMNGKDLNFLDNHFFYASMLGVIGGIEQKARLKLLEEAFRVLAPGGKLMLVEFERSNQKDQKEKYERDKIAAGEMGIRIVKDQNGKILFYGKHFKEEELRKLFASAGFESIQVKRQALETIGPGDGKPALRKQIAICGEKPAHETRKQYFKENLVLDSTVACAR